MICQLCPNHCELKEGKSGICHARTNLNGVIVNSSYGRLTAVALDPIEKKPLARFYPISKILSVGSYGCNLHCPFCQNSDISMTDGKLTDTFHMSPEQLVRQAESLRPQGNIGIAFTYNEPLIGYEYVRDCSKLAHEKGLKTVLVTNGMFCRELIIEMLPLIDAMNIDLKSFTQRFYDMLGGDLETVKQTISLAVKACHVEVTTLIIPKENDSEEEMEELSTWLSNISADIPLHISRFYPRYKMKDRAATSISTIARLYDIASKHLTYVYTGNC